MARTTPRFRSRPDLPARLATVQMHAMQTSGNCVRNITSDELAGITSEEFEEPCPRCEIVRQCASIHPKFLYLPRKFKIALTGSPSDRAVTQAPDIGLQLVGNQLGAIGFRVIVGGGLGRTPIARKVLTEFLPKAHLLAYLESILRLYNLKGRRDNKYKARIKILVQSMGVGEFAMLGMEIDGKPLMRAYSMASANHEDHLEFYSIKVKQEALTSRMWYIREGDLLLVSKKHTGALLWGRLNPGKTLYLLSTGTGPAPFLSIRKDPQVYENFEKVILVRGCRYINELICRHCQNDFSHQHSASFPLPSSPGTPAYFPATARVRAVTI